MDIRYLKKLNTYPSIKSKHTDNIFSLKSLSESEIVELESAYNSGTKFPTALRELLYLAGADCYVLDYGINDSQAEMQERSRSHLVRAGKVIDRPFYVIDVYNEGDQFLFVDLDGGDDPIVYEAVLYVGSTETWIHNLAHNMRLSEYIDGGIDKLLNGRNPL